MKLKFILYGICVLPPAVRSVPPRSPSVIGGPLSVTRSQRASGAGTEHGATSSGSCARRFGAYPAQLDRNASFAGGPHSFDFIACSSAVINDLLSNQLGPFATNEIASQQAATISIGGNDALFVDVLDACILRAFLWRLTTSCESALQASSDAIDKIADRLVDVYTRILQIVVNGHGVYDFTLYVTGTSADLIRAAECSDTRRQGHDGQLT